MASESHRRKYICNFYKKKKQLNNILLSKVNMLSVSKDELVKFHHILQAQTILKTFFNAATLQYKEYTKEIMCLSDFSNIWSYRDFKQGGKSWLYYFLLHFKLYRLAFLMTKILN